MKNTIMFLDETIIELTAGKGGNGCLSFHREKFLPKGGPDGGNGGRGGHIILRSSKNLHTLFDLDKNNIIRAPNGQNGGSFRSTGKNGKDIILKLPVGTVVKALNSDHVLHDLNCPGDSFTAVKGGKGGKGNHHFKTAKKKAPDFCTDGMPGEHKKVRLILKLIADCGLVGSPNAGKSSLLSRLSNASPKTADYAFTTLKPYLGIAALSHGGQFVLADIPGLIEGAARGKGLGNRFLRHIERTSCLAFVLDVSGSSPWKNYLELKNELKTYQPALLHKPRI
ncbi:Obg family GTPase CgtA, partial [Fibrobacterota bacterium]